MAVLSETLLTTSSHLRPFDVRHDLNAVADLVELCFADTIDYDGQRYLRQMRETARSAGFLRLAYLAADQASLPLSGFVWEEDGLLVGNLSLIPFFPRGKRIYLIANVAVHPNFRRRGIARALTLAALEYTRTRRTSATWLQVRDDNQAAIRLYLSLGFRELARRTTWQSMPFERNVPLYASLSRPGLVISRRKAIDWTDQKAWLKHAYPPDLSWHIPLNVETLRPDLLGIVYRFFNLSHFQHWSIQHGGRVLALVTWQATPSYSDTLWLAIPDGVDEAALLQLLLFVRQHISTRRPLTLDHPAGKVDEAIRLAGFVKHQTLIWMKAGEHKG